MGISVRYHEATKYSPETIGSHPGLDPTTQPVPFKEFHSSERIALGPHLLLRRDARTGSPVLKLPSAGDAGVLSRLSTLLLHTNGVTAVLGGADERQFFRAAPSAGALYPTELYVAVRDTDGIAPGIYNYQVRDHSLAPLCEGSFRGDIEYAVWNHPAAAEAKVIVFASAVYFRSSWRYHDRAYRRILLDTGHVIENLCLFAPLMGWRPFVFGGFRDGVLNSLFLFDETKEGMLALVALCDGEPSFPPQPAPASPPRDFDADENLLLSIHRAGRIDAKDAVAPAADVRPIPARHFARGAETPLEVEPGDWSAALSPRILTRRSTRRFTSRPISFAAFAGLLVDVHADRGSSFLALEHMRTFIAVSRVGDLKPGLYWYDPERKLLHLRKHLDPSLSCGAICLSQDLGSDAAFVVFHCVDLPALEGAFGDRGYRYVGLDAGRLGERLNLGASIHGMGASGIGGYFDDSVNDLFGLGPEMAVIYVTCIGEPFRP